MINRRHESDVLPGLSDDDFSRLTPAEKSAVLNADHERRETLSADQERQRIAEAADTERRRIKLDGEIERQEMADSEAAAHLSEDLKEGEAETPPDTAQPTQPTSSSKGSRVGSVAGGAVIAAGLIPKGIKWIGYGASAFFTKLDTWGGNMLKKTLISKIPFLGDWLTGKPGKTWLEQARDRKKVEEAEEKKRAAEAKRAKEKNKKATDLEKAIRETITEEAEKKPEEKPAEKPAEKKAA